MDGHEPAGDAPPDPGRPPGPPGAVPVLGLDVGSTNVKAVRVLLDADRGTVTEVAVRSARTPDDPAALVDVVRALVADVLRGGPPPRAVGVASMAETGVPLDRDGRPLTALLRWDGRRGADAAAQLTRDVGAAALFAATGVRPSAKVPLVTWHWLRRTQPALWSRVDRWAGAADLVVLALTGRLVTDHTLAGRTMAYRLPGPGAPVPDGFDPDLLGLVGWTPDRLPDVARPGEPAGTVTHPGFAAGLPPGTPVVVAGHDHAVGTWAAGVREPGDRADSIGTAEAVLTVLDRPVDRARVAAEGMSLVRTVAGGREAVLAGSPAAGGMVRWWSGTVLAGRPITDVLPTLAPPEPTGVLVLPYPHGRQSPRPDPTARVRVLDPEDRDVTHRALAPAHEVTTATRRHAVAVLEGLALHSRWMLDAQGAVAAAGPGGGHGAPGPGPAGGPVVVLAGAAATNAVWMGAKAALAGAPVRLVTAAEPVATGAALLAAERVGLVPPGTLRLPARPESSPAPDADRTVLLDRFVAAATAPVPRDVPAPPAHLCPEAS